MEMPSVDIQANGWTRPPPYAFTSCT